MTPGRDWRREYAQRSAALAKLDYCDRTMQRLNVQDPPVVAAELDQDVGELAYSLRDYYRNLPTEGEPSAGLDGDLRAIFDDLEQGEESAIKTEALPAGGLIRRLERPLTADVFRWTGHFPERTRSLMRHLAKRADDLGQVYPKQSETEAVIGVTILVTSLAMNFVHRGSYFPEAQPASPTEAAAPKEAPPVAAEAPAAKGEATEGGDAAGAKSAKK
jgi:hypothetical protein